MSAIRNLKRSLRVRASRVAHHSFTRRLTHGPAPGAVENWEGDIRPVRKEEFDPFAAYYPYYRDRWDYFSVAGDAAAELIDGQHMRSALELGPMLRPLIVGSTLMDRWKQRGTAVEDQFIERDALDIPWPFADDEFDLFVALQVFEHLGPDQARVFDEVRRVARSAIISLPIDWRMVDPADCHFGITTEEALSWFAPVAPSAVMVGTPAPWTRLVFVFDDLAVENDRR